MRLLLIASVFAAAGFIPAMADSSASIGQLGVNDDETGKRSNANLNQIGVRTVDSGGLVDQIDPEDAADRDDIDESHVSEILPAEFDGQCALSPSQEAIMDYLKAEGQVFEDNCAVIAWLNEKNADDPSERDLFNVIFGPEAERQQKAEVERLEAERARAEARAQMLEAMMNGGPPQ
ncbi:hypothetical protein [Henriciella sp.]|uniref:hypothetical protein n=1 Tax=Henriciella sp. TaxID=1968823 RepID=UPI00260DA5F6|nr:hypothetical protein [Henriciella sp.]